LFPKAGCENRAQGKQKNRQVKDRQRVGTIQMFIEPVHPSIIGDPTDVSVSRFSGKIDRPGCRTAQSNYCQRADLPLSAPQDQGDQQGGSADQEPGDWQMVKENVDIFRLLQLVEQVGKSASFYTTQVKAPAFLNSAQKVGARFQRARLTIGSMFTGKRARRKRAPTRTGFGPFGRIFMKNAGQNKKPGPATAGPGSEFYAC